VTEKLKPRELVRIRTMSPNGRTVANLVEQVSLNELRRIFQVLGSYAISQDCDVAADMSMAMHDYDDWGDDWVREFESNLSEGFDVSGLNPLWDLVVGFICTELSRTVDGLKSRPFNGTLKGATRDLWVTVADYIQKCVDPSDREWIYSDVADLLYFVDGDEDEDEGRWMYGFAEIPQPTTTCDAKDGNAPAVKVVQNGQDSKNRRPWEL